MTFKIRIEYSVSSIESKKNSYQFLVYSFRLNTKYKFVLRPNKDSSQFSVKNKNTKFKT